MATEKEVLQFKLQMQVDEALKNFKTLNRSGSSVFKALNKGSQLFSKGLKKVADINLALAQVLEFAAVVVEPKRLQT